MSLEYACFRGSEAAGGERRGERNEGSEGEGSEGEGSKIVDRKINRTTDYSIHYFKDRL